ncbi:MAG: hypothetical protein PF569_03190 [Candidatus Woesearchaeota archaeon]|jgi:hypothetical protein|nr:hypothetical protein [Candidatus Woesearchaeota archaeon]
MTTKRQQAESKATSALSLFMNAISKLEKSVDISESLVIENSDKIDTLLEENTTMKDLSEKNKRIIDNISSLIKG